MWHYRLLMSNKRKKDLGLPLSNIRILEHGRLLEWRHLLQWGHLMEFLVCNHVTRWPCWMIIYNRIFLEKFTWNRVPRGGKCFCSCHRDVTCKAAIWALINKSTFKEVQQSINTINEYSSIFPSNLLLNMHKYNRPQHFPKCCFTYAANARRNTSPGLFTFYYLRVAVNDINRFAYIEWPPKSPGNDINRFCLHRVITKIDYFNMAAAPI